jgi:hypothetical protein
MITLIANSGIQFHTFDIVLDANDEVPNRRIGFYEHIKNGSEIALE